MNIEGKKLIWKDYQKEIADDNYFYARSCIRQNFFPASEATFMKIMTEELKKTISDMQQVLDNYKLIYGL